MIELALLCIIAIISGMLAWALNRPPFVAVFIAQAAFVGLRSFAWIMLSRLRRRKQT